ncbi:mariner Mos1 transposase [Trichonephila clavipes]|nr:mariner Mos1 transposase [Trichonephila clavipes]
MQSREISIKTCDVTKEFNVSIGTVHNFVNILKNQKICCQWVLCMMPEHHKIQQTCPSLQYLLHYRDALDDFLQHIVAGDEIWCHNFQPERKSVSMQWKRPDPPWPKKFKTAASGKVMLMAFFHMKGLQLLEFKEPNILISTQHYTRTLDKLHKAIKTNVQKVGSPGSSSLQSRPVTLRQSHLWTAEEKLNGSTITLRRCRKAGSMINQHRSSWTKFVTFLSNGTPT